MLAMRPGGCPPHKTAKRRVICGICCPAEGPAAGQICVKEAPGTAAVPQKDQLRDSFASRSCMQKDSGTHANSQRFEKPTKSLAGRLWRPRRV